MLTGLTELPLDLVTVHRGPGGQSCTRVWASALTAIVDIEGDGFRSPKQRQIPRHCVCRAAGMLDPRALKSNGRIFFHSKEAGGTQVGITQYIMRIDTGRVDFCLYPGTGRVLLIDMQMTAQRVEVSSRRSN